MHSLGALAFLAVNFLTVRSSSFWYNITWTVNARPREAITTRSKLSAVIDQRRMVEGPDHLRRFLADFTRHVG